MLIELHTDRCTFCMGLLGMYSLYVLPMSVHTHVGMHTHTHTHTHTSLRTLMCAHTLVHPVHVCVCAHACVYMSVSSEGKGSLLASKPTHVTRSDGGCGGVDQQDSGRVFDVCVCGGGYSTLPVPSLVACAPQHTTQCCVVPSPLSAVL